MASSTQLYIEKYAEYAMEQMRRYGIPASITLAQGIIESANGNSTLARTANNHFGVKGEFNGAYVLANDDKPNEKFKKYDNVGQSFEDHSKVLMKPHFQKYVGNLSPDDYKGWATGIKKGGYATASNYVSSLVNVVEKYDLHKYDEMVMEQMKKEGRKFGVSSNPSSVQSSEKSALKQTGFDLPEGKYSMPVQRESFMLVTSPYGQRRDPMDRSKTQIHHGIDIKTNGDDVFSTEDKGKVVGVDPRTNTGGGKTVTVEYSREDGSKTVVQYMHLSQINVKEGDSVDAGQKLGVSGNTGTRTTGEHLHFGVYNISAEGKKQWVNPAAYLAELNVKGNLQKEAQYNGKNLLEEYQVKETTQQNGEQDAEVKQEKQEVTPETWLQKIFGSKDAGLDSGGGLLDSLMELLATLLLLSMQLSNKSKEEKIQTVTESLINKRVDLSDFTPNLKSSELSIKDNGSAVLVTDDGNRQYSHTLTAAESAKLSQILHSDLDDATKQQRIGSFVYGVTFSQQASLNYEEISSRQLEQEQTLQRK